ncbi:MAG: DMT family transporter [Gemmatimonadales bacterium]
MPLTRSGWSRHDLGMVVVSLIWGANFTANKYALGTIPPIAFGAARFLLASALLWLIVRWRGRPETVPRATYRRLLLLGLVGNTGYQVLFMVGLMSTTAVNASLIMASMPIMVGAGCPVRVSGPRAGSGSGSALPPSAWAS